jgi:thioredoxin-like negative regulator of GroEL
MATVVRLNDDGLVESVEQGLTLVDFRTPLCGLCTIQRPIVQRVAGKVGDGVKVAELNVDEAQCAAIELGIHAIPTVILFRDGKPAQRFAGVTKEGTLIWAIDAAQSGISRNQHSGTR